MIRCVARWAAARRYYEMYEGEDRFGQPMLVQDAQREARQQRFDDRQQIGFGITQSGGSRYELGRGLPNPAKILLTLYLSGKVTDEELSAARKAAGIPVTAKVA
jgi:hypothetical protein